MNRKEIPPTEFFQCIHELMTKSMPLLAVFVANDGAIAKLYGFVDSAADEMGLVFSSHQGTPSVSSTVSVPIVDGCKFFREVTSDLPDTDRERLELSYGNTSLLMHLPSASRFMVFFTGSGS